MGVPTQRPDDYFAEMAKSDKHMEKVRAKLIASKSEKDRREAARNLREQKRFSGHVQKRVLEQRLNEKRQLNLAVKKHKKGMKLPLEEILG